MTLIEGVGDEVTDFFIVVAILIVGYLAWCSTRISDRILIHTVLILELRTRTRIASLRGSTQNTTSISQQTSSETSEEQTGEPALTDNNNETVNACNNTLTRDETEELPVEENRRIDSNPTEEVLIEVMDSHNNDISNPQGSNNVNTNDTEVPHPTCTDEQEDVATSNTDEISIKLKFMNDDQKLVTGGLKELLGDFKRRHFEIELQAQKLVRLVFNGRILQPDSQTLEKCGLYNNCVVHCLVHQPRPNPVPDQSTPVEDTSMIYFRPQAVPVIPSERIIRPITDEWDLSRLLVSILTLLLGLAWYSRYHYAQLFTATSTFVLYALTAIFTVSLFSNFFPDQDNIRNIE